MSTLELSQSGLGLLRMPAETAGVRRLPAVSRTDSVIRASTAAVVLAVAGIAAYISYWHAYAVVRQYGESGVTALLEPGTIDGLVYASSMVVLHAARHRLPVPRLARWMLALGIAASLAVNVAQGWSHGLVGAAAAAWPAVALVGSYELLAWMIRTAGPGGPGHVLGADHGAPQADQPGISRPPAGSLTSDAVPVARAGDGASPGCDSAHDQLSAAHAVAPVRGPGPAGPGCAGQAARANQGHQANQACGPVPESTGPGGPDGAAVPGSAAVRAPAGDVDAAAVAAYSASVREGRQLSERKLAAAFGKTSRRWARNRIAEARQAPATYTG
jgi:hypothetical protein